MNTYLSKANEQGSVVSQTRPSNHIFTLIIATLQAHEAATKNNDKDFDNYMNSKCFNTKIIHTDGIIISKSNGKQIQIVYEKLSQIINKSRFYPVVVIG